MVCRSNGTFKKLFSFFYLELKTELTEMLALKPSLKILFTLSISKFAKIFTDHLFLPADLVHRILTLHIGDKDNKIS